MRSEPDATALRSDPGAMAVRSEPDAMVAMLGPVLATEAQRT